MTTFPTKLSPRLDRLAVALSTARRAVMDWEATGLKPRFDVPTGLGVFLPDTNQAFYINVNHTLPDERFPRFKATELADVLRTFLENRSRHVIVHNAGFDLRLFIKYDIDIVCRVSDTVIHQHRVDENLTSFSTSPTYHPHIDADDMGYKLKSLTTIFTNERPPTLQDAAGERNTMYAEIKAVADYCIQDCYNTWQLYQRAQQQINADPQLLELIETIDDPNSAIVARMMWEGIEIDVAEARKQREIYFRSIQKCRELIWNLTNTRRGLDNKDGILALLRGLRIEDEIGYDPFFVPFWSDKAPELTREILTDIFEQLDDPIRKQVIAAILSKWTMTQRITSFCNPLEDRAWTGRLYPSSFMSTQSSTRFSSSPNMQNLPGRADAVADEFGPISILPEDCRDHHKTRNLFKAKTGNVLVSFDLSAAEPRYLAVACQKAITDQDIELHTAKAILNAERDLRYHDLIQRMKATRRPFIREPTEPEPWPKIANDPLWLAFKADRDPYEALLEAWDQEEFLKATLSPDERTRKNARSIGKLAFLATCYGITAKALAPQLSWSLEKTEQAIANLDEHYPMIPALKRLVTDLLVSTGEVRTLWGRPRRMNGYYQLTRPKPLVAQIVRRRTPRGDKLVQRYKVEMIPLGTWKQGVQAFVQRCTNIESGQVVMEANPDGTLKSMFRGSTFVNAALGHFNQPPFCNISYSTIEWVQELDTGLIRWLPYQQKAARILFNAIFQGTGADHLRWLMNNMDAEVCRRDEFRDCRLIVTVHDSLVYETPESKYLDFVKAAMPVLTRKPKWATVRSESIDIKVDAEVGSRYGEMKKLDLTLL